jgi:hypothetical protein
MAPRRDGFQRHVMGALHGPFVVLFEQDFADEASIAASLGKGYEGWTEWPLAGR